MEVLVCAATSGEARACKSGIRASGCSERIEVLRTGIGPENARKTLEARLARAPRPRIVVSSGFAGACGAETPLHSWVTADRIAPAAQAPRTAGFGALPFAAPGTQICRLVSSTELIVSQGMRVRAAVGLRPPVAVDMESAALAQAAQSHGIPLLVWRVVTDTVDSPPPEFLRAYADTMSRTPSGARARDGLAVLAVAAILHPIVFGRCVRSIAVSSRTLRDGWERHAARMIELARAG